MGVFFFAGASLFCSAWNFDQRATCAAAILFLAAALMCRFLGAEEAVTASDEGDADLAPGL